MNSFYVIRGVRCNALIFYKSMESVSYEKFYLFLYIYRYYIVSYYSYIIVDIINFMFIRNNRSRCYDIFKTILGKNNIIKQKIRDRILHAPSLIFIEI